jgi:hypothetical protein
MPAFFSSLANPPEHIPRGYFRAKYASLKWTMRSRCAKVTPVNAGGKEKTCSFVATTLITIGNTIWFFAHIRDADPHRPDCWSAATVGHGAAFVTPAPRRRTSALK